MRNLLSQAKIILFFSLATANFSFFYTLWSLSIGPFSHISACGR